MSGSRKNGRSGQNDSRAPTLTKRKSKVEEEEEIHNSNGDLNDDDELLVTDHEDPEDIRDDHGHVSCKECTGVFTQEDFERHQNQTGHTGETIRLPPILSI